MQLDPSNPFDLDSTLCCGQAFRWNKRGDWWFGVVDEKAFRIRQKDDALEFENVDADFVRGYFRLQDDLPKIFSKINKGKRIAEAIDEFKGLRVLQQEPWECLISYVCATYKSIAAIKRMILNLSREFGEERSSETGVFYAFPTPAKLAKATVHQLAGCGLGYRARYVLETAKIVNKGDLDFKQLRRATYEKAKSELMDLPGVGSKVADCVLLFSLDKLEAFPVDVWMRRVILKHYAKHFPKEFIKRISREKSLSNAAYNRLNLFGREYFGEYAGYAQEYLYHYERIEGQPSHAAGDHLVAENV